MNGRLGLFEYIYKEDLAVSADGETPETQHITFRAVDGVLGRFYQIVFPHNTGCWSFSSPDELSYMAQDFINMANSISSQ